MGKACIALGSAAVSLLVAYTQIPPEGDPWYRTALLIAFAVAGISFLLIGLVYLYLLGKKHLNPLDILDDWRCTYWPSERQLQVTLWFRDISGASTFKIAVDAQFGQLLVGVGDNVTIGGTYMGKSGIKSGQNQPTMLECFKYNVDLCDVDTATVVANIRPLGGLWAAKKRSKVVSVQRIDH